jgi:hypothetical protein
MPTPAPQLKLQARSRSLTSMRRHDAPYIVDASIGFPLVDARLWGRFTVRASTGRRRSTPLNVMVAAAQADSSKHLRKGAARSHSPGAGDSLLARGSARFAARDPDMPGVQPTRC